MYIVLNAVIVNTVFVSYYR